MNSYEILNRLDDSGELKYLVRNGLMPVKIGTHLEIYRFVDAMVQTGVPKTKAVNEASDKMNVCRTTVFKILRTLK